MTGTLSPFEPAPPRATRGAGGVRTVRTRRRGLGRWFAIGGSVVLVAGLLLGSWTVLPTSHGSRPSPSPVGRPESAPPLEVPSERPRGAAGSLSDNGTGGGATPSLGPSWREVFPATNPGPRVAAAMAYDAAAGYTVLFGGEQESTITSNGLGYGSNCTNATWTYRAGAWTNLSIPGPPRLESCSPLISYDPQIGGILAFIGPYCCGGSYQTWEFVDGAWSRVITFTPRIETILASMAYDAASQSVILFGANDNIYGNDSTWAFADGFWQEVNTTPLLFTPDGGSAPWWTMTYDESTDSLLLVQGDNVTNRSVPGGIVTTAWSFANGTWSSAGTIPLAYYAGGVEYDPREGYDVLYGGFFNPGPGPQPSTLGYNWTWADTDGVWSNLSIPGPPPRINIAMTFDAADGYLLLYGGLVNPSSGCSPYTPCRLLSDTWAFGSPPAAVQLRVSAIPSAICSAAAPACGLGTDATTVRLSVTVGSATGQATRGVDDGNGSVVYGPYDWLAAPTLTYVGWGNLSLTEPFEPVVTCGLANGTPGDCPATPAMTVLPDGQPVVTWSWEGVGPASSLRPGDWWNITFSLTAEGPPYAIVPVDRCATTVCARAEGALAAPYTSLGFSEDGGLSRLQRSFALGTVTVIGPQASGGGAPPGPISPPPPPPVGVPAPVAAPNPTVVTNPSGPGVLGGLLSSLSPVGAGAGILAAGTTRAVVSRSRSAVLLRAGRHSAGRRAASPSRRLPRGED